MKKLHLVLASLATATSFLFAPQAAWANESDDSQESSSAVSESSKELENKEQEEAFFKTLLKVEPSAIDKGQDKIFESSKNWMYEAVDGKEPPKPTERPYKIPEDWKLHPSLIKDEAQSLRGTTLFADTGAGQLIADKEANPLVLFNSRFQSARGYASSSQGRTL